MRILIVDDVKLNVMSIVKYLNNEYEIDVAYNGEEALSKIETFKPNIILLYNDASNGWLCCFTNY